MQGVNYVFNIHIKKTKLRRVVTYQQIKESITNKIVALEEYFPPPPPPTPPPTLNPPCTDPAMKIKCSCS